MLEAIELFHLYNHYITLAFNMERSGVMIAWVQFMVLYCFYTQSQELQHSTA